MRSFTQFINEERINLASFNLPALYRKLNHDLFNGELPEVPIVFGKTPKSAAGMTLAQARRIGPLRQTVPGSISITIRPYAYDDDVLKGIVAHEMIHVWCIHHDRHERDMHGYQFVAKLTQVQRLASFKIPMSHKSEDDEHGAPKDVAFIAAMRGGQRYVVLLSKSFVDKPDAFVRAQAQCERWTKNGFQWAAYGTAKSVLANTLVVARDFTRTTGMYKLDTFKLLNVQRILHVSGTPDFT